MPDALRVLGTKYAELERRQFPRTHPLPEEFDDLYAEWAELDGFVVGLTQRALAGKRLSPEEVVPFRHLAVRQRLAEFSDRHPEVARPILDEFNFLDDILDLLGQIARGEQEEEH